MKKPQWILIICGLALLMGLFIFGNTTPPPPKMENIANKATTPIQPNFNFDEYKQKAYLGLNENQKKEINSLETKGDTKSLLAISKIYTIAKQSTISAKYISSIAKLENTEKSLTFASQQFIDLYNIEQDTALKVWQAAQAVELLEKVLSINPNNENAKVKLAQSYTDGTGETMKGVLMLREVAQKNPDNLQAGIALGRLAVQSGQYDKAITRLEKLQIKYKNNSEVMYHLAEAYKGKGEIAKAKELFIQCKQIVNNPNFSKEIDNYIKTF